MVQRPQFRKDFHLCLIPVFTLFSVRQEPGLAETLSHRNVFLITKGYMTTQKLQNDTYPTRRMDPCCWHWKVFLSTSLEYPTANALLGTLFPPPKTQCPRRDSMQMECGPSKNRRLNILHSFVAALYRPLRLRCTDVAVTSALCWIEGHSSGTHVVMFWVLMGTTKLLYTNKNYFQSCDNHVIIMWQSCVSQFRIYQ